MSQPDNPTSESKDLWALKDVSFEVKRGEVLGIIGRNGAGKSTLLKILTRITEPTSGRAIMRGRVASLLEVGTGFHPELTGRENIFLNGAILGMRKAEIATKFDEIVAFSEVEKFIDTPVKRYSSGMYVRLAFAVAAHLDPEILLVDEVLAVGDAGFQKKCLGKMRDVAQHGRTVLFVSHNMTAVVTLCKKALWLDEGLNRKIDVAGRAVQSYLAVGVGVNATGGRLVFDEPESAQEASLSSIELRNANNEITTDFEVTSAIRIMVAFCCRRRFLRLRIDVAVTRHDGIMVFATTTHDYDSISGEFELGRHAVQITIPGRFLAAGGYSLSVNVCECGVKNYDLKESVMRFRVLGNPFRDGRTLGLLVYPFEWKLLQNEEK
jgi:lipopolysaccharide transport system ATP-binding protein